MFRVTIPLSVIVLVFSFLCILIFIGIGHSQQTPFTLRIVDGLACDVYTCSASLSENYVPIHSEKYNNVFTGVTTYEEGLLHYDSFSVRYWHWKGELATQVLPTTEQVLLGNVIAHYGVPCSVTITEEDINLQYSDLFVNVLAFYDLKTPETLSRSISPTMKIQYIQLLGEDISCETPLTFPMANNITTGWYGFRSINYYILHRTHPYNPIN